MSSIRGTPGMAAALLVLALTGNSAVADTTSAAIGFVGDTDSSSWRGASMGLDEINVAGRFIGYEFSLESVDAGDIPDGLVALVVAADAKSVKGLVERHPDLPVFNTLAEDDDLRTLCPGNLYSIIPSERMRSDAVAQWREKEPDADVDAVAHHHRFRRYSSGDLNGRYTTTYDEPMTEAAWTAFVAVRLVGDAVTRTQATDLQTLHEHLHGLTSFDASKGQPLSFRDNGQLRQPLWIVKDDRVLGEAPVEGVVDRDDMDTLGIIDGCAEE